MDESEVNDFELGKILAQCIGMNKLNKHPRCSEELIRGYMAGWNEGWANIKNEEKK